MAHNIFLLLEFVHPHLKLTQDCLMQSPTLHMFWPMVFISSLIPSFSSSQIFSKIPSHIIALFFFFLLSSYTHLCGHVYTFRVHLIPPSPPIHICRDLKWGRYVSSVYHLDSASQWFIKIRHPCKNKVLFFLHSYAIIH